jgi:hypothetical protein
MKKASMLLILAPDKHYGWPKSRLPCNVTAKFGLTVVAHKDVVLYADRVATQEEADAFYASRPQKYQARYRQLKAFPSLLRAYDAKTGRKLWEVPAGESFHTPTDVFVINDTVWYTTTPAMLEGNLQDGLDLRSTGKVIKSIGDAEDINHGRCYRNRSTVKYLLGGTSWT